MKHNIDRLKIAAARRVRDHAQFWRIRKLMLGLLGMWIVYFLVVHIYITALNKLVVPVLGMPLGVYLPVQGSVIVFAVLLFWFSRKAG